MLRCVKLERLPEGISFPDKLADRVNYDPVSRELQFDGFMSKTDFDKLVHLHNDIAYQRALERLFQICTYEPETVPGRPRSSLMLMTAGATAAIVALVVTVFMLVY